MKLRKASAGFGIRERPLDQPKTTLLRTFDDVTVLGVFVALSWLLICLNVTQRGTWGQLLWLCDVATAATALGLLVRSPLLLTAQFAGMLVYHLSWHIDILLYVFTGLMPFQATAYMFSGSWSSYEKALSFFQHTFMLPACLWGLLRLGAARYGWLLQWFQTVIVFLLTFLFTQPSENINWVFGAGFPSSSPAAGDPSGYYLVIALVAPFVIYMPANRLASYICGRYRTSSPPNIRYASSALIGVVIFGAILAGAIGRISHPFTEFPETLLDSPSDGLAAIETLPDDPWAPTVESITYGAAPEENEIPLIAWRQPLPRQGGQNRNTGPLSLAELQLAGDTLTIPWAPQQVTIGGKRGRTGTVVCAVIGADGFYVQPLCDTDTALEHFQVYGRIGLEGLSEFTTVHGERRPAASNQVIRDGRLQSFFVVTVVAFDGRIATRSPFYVLQRTGIWERDDVVWINSDGRWTARVR